MKYIVYLVGGDRDGETIGTFDNERDAVLFAQDFCKENDSALGIVDENNNVVIDW